MEKIGLGELIVSINYHRVANIKIKALTIRRNVLYRLNSHVINLSLPSLLARKISE